MNIKRPIRCLTTLLLAVAFSLPVWGASRDTTLVVLVEAGPNSLDIQSVGANRPAYQIAVNIYDRLIRFGTKTLPDGNVVYDHTKLEPELAESWEMSPDGTSVTFKLRQDATFWDGSPVTAEDVKWSLDRMVSIGGFPSVQAKAGNMTEPAQFTVVDPHTVKVDFRIKHKWSLPDLAVPTAAIYNSKIAKTHATKDDPWAVEYTKRNPLGGGAYMVERWDPGQQVVLKRFDDWKSGPLPKLERIVIRDIPSAANRRALLERGDADVSMDVPPKDASELLDHPKAKIVGSPAFNTIWYLGMNMNNPPFNDVRVRQALAYAMPYDEIIEASVYGRGTPLFGADSMTVSSGVWPTPTGYTTDMEKAKALMKEAGMEEGFAVPFYIDLGNAGRVEPMALLIQEALAKLNIETTIEKVPAANWRSKMVEKTTPLYINNFGGWLNYPEYFFFWAYDGANRIFNDMGYKNERVDTLVATSQLEEDPDKYKKQINEMIQIAYDEVPRIPLYQPYLDMGLARNVDGYVNYFHRQLDFRSFVKM